MIKTLLSVSSLFLMFSAFGQNKEKATLLFSYDDSGNQIKRFFQVTVSSPRKIIQVVEDTTLETVFQLVPNPTTGPFDIRWNTTEEIQDVELYDLLGLKINNFILNKGFNRVEINISSVPSGIYILRFVTTTGKIITQKIIKK